MHVWVHLCMCCVHACTMCRALKLAQSYVLNFTIDIVLSIGTSSCPLTMGARTLNVYCLWQELNSCSCVVPWLHGSVHNSVKHNIQLATG